MRMAVESPQFNASFASSTLFSGLLVQSLNKMLFNVAKNAWHESKVCKAEAAVGMGCKPEGILNVKIYFRDV